jgi:RNA polymerase sigma factor (sigma-70 family)
VRADDALAVATDVALLDAARAGQASAWSVLVGRYDAKLYAIARSFGLDQSTAEDLAQTAWLRLLERGNQVRDVASLGSWLATVVRNDARKIVTRRLTVPVGDGFDRRADDGRPPDTRLLTDERGAALRLAFASLGDECRQLLRLLTADPPLSYDEIAAALGRPRGALGPTRARCLQHLRRALPTGFEP